jgi:outer membrane biosynthesis protein TonB
MGRIIYQEPVRLPQRPTTNPPKSVPSATEKTPDSPNKPTQTPATAPDKKTQDKKEEAPVKETPKTAVAPKKENPPQTTVQPKSEDKPSLGKQVVIPRGTRVDAVLNDSYQYHLVQDGMKITLSVETDLERSGVVVVKAGAKVHAVLHKNARKTEMELIITEIESVTGTRLKSMSTSFKASSFQKGEKYKINLDYNRLN